MTATSAKQEILRRIRSAKGGTSDAVVTQAEWSGLSREYKRVATLDAEAMLARLEHRLRDYDAHVLRIPHSRLADAIAQRLTERGKHRLVIPAGLANPLPAGFDLVVDDGLSAAELDAFDGVLTQSTAAIAETGTIILHDLPGQGRRALTLVPDYHLCLVRTQDVVETVPEAMARIAPLAGVATTFVSGPSATADIEMTRIKGVHGPRHLDVILYDAAQS